MDRFDYKEITSNCLKVAIKELTEALALYQKEQYLHSEKKIADVIYRTTSALHLINIEKEKVPS